MRQSAFYIVEFVASLVNDTQYERFSQELILDALDVYRWEAAQDVTALGVIKRTAATTAYKAYVTQAPWQYWETDTVIEDSQYNQLTADSVDYRNSRWSFTTPRQDRYLWVTGFSHDPYAAAHKLLSKRGAAVSEDLQSFSTQNGTFTYAASPMQNVMAAAMDYWRQSRAGTCAKPIIRTDLTY